MANQTSNYQLKVGVVTDQASFKILQQSLQNIINLAKQPGNELNKELQQAAKNAQLTQRALESSFNTKTGTLNIAKMNKELEKSNLNVSTLRNSFSKVGANGANAFNTLAAASMRAGVQIKKTNKLLDSFATTMTNTVKWGITSGIWNSITSQLSGAVTYVEKLDHSLNDIRVVTNKNASAMAEFAKQANKAAQALGASTTDYTDAALIYYQQGLAEAEVKARTEVTMKTANVTRQSTDEVSEQLTAVWNGYKVSAQEAELYIDKLAAVAASTAADLEELSTGMSKVASAASEMGVDVDQLNAQLATIVSVTRQAPESVGTALKTIYARMGDLAIGGEDEFGVSLGTVSGQLAEVGIAVLDQSGNLRDMGDVMEEVAAKWDTWNESQRTAIAIAMAGKRQYNNLIALFSNWDMYSDAIKTSENAMGTLSRQQDIYMESTDAKLQKVTTSWEKLYSTLIKTSELNWGIDTINQLVQSFDNLASSFGGGIKTIGAAVAIIASLSSSKIGEGLINRGRNQAIDRANASTIRLRDQVKESSLIDTFNIQEGSARAIMLENQARENTDFVEKYDAVRAGLTNDQYNKIIDYARKRADINYQADEKKWDNEQTIKEYNKRFSKNNQEILKLNEKKDNLFGEKKKEVEDEIKLLKQRNQEIKKNINALKEENIAIDKKAANDVFDIQQTLDDEIGNVEDLQKYANMQMQLDALAGSAQLVAGSIMSVHSAFAIWSNDDLSFTEKLTQSIMSLTPAISLAISGIKKLNEANLFSTKVTEVFSKETMKNTLAVIFNKKAKDANAKSTDNLGKDIKDATRNVKEDTVKQGGKLFGKVLGKGLTVGVTAAVVAAIVAAIAIARKIIQIKAKNELEKATKDAETAIEKATNTKEASDRINNLTQEFKNLSTEIEAQGGYTVDLQNKVHDLCLQYGEEQLAVDSLAMSYEQLQIKMKKLQEDSAEAARQSAERAQDSLSTQLSRAIDEKQSKNNLWRGFWSSLNQWDYNVDQYGNTYFTFDKAEKVNRNTGERRIHTGAIYNQKEQDFFNSLKEIEGINLEGDGNSGGFALSFDYDTLYKEENWNALQDLMNNAYSVVGGEWGYKEVEEIFNVLSEQAASYQELLSSEQENSLRKLTAGLDQNTIKSSTDYISQKRQLLSGTEGILSDEEAQNWVKNTLATLNDEVSRQAMIEGELRLNLNPEDKYTWNEEIQEWTEDEKNFVFLHLDKVKSLKEAKELIADFKKYLDISFSSSSLGLISNLLKNEGALSKEQIDNLYQRSRFNINKEDFRRMSEEEQKNALTRFSFDEIAYVAANQQTVLDDLNKKQKEFMLQNESQVNDNYTQAYDSIINNIKATMTEENAARFTEDYIQLLARSEGKLSKGSQEEKDYKQFIEGKSIIKATKALDDYNDELEIYQSSISSVQNIQGLWQKQFDETTTALEKQKNSLKTFQSAYSTLTEVVSNYNNHGKITIDNLFSLLEQEPQYINALSMENGQLELNQATMDSILDTKLQTLKATYIQNTASQMMLTLEGQKIKLEEEELTLLGNIVNAGLESGQSYEEIAKAVAEAGLEFDNLDVFIESVALRLDMFAEVADKAKEAVNGFKDTLKWEEEFDEFWTLNKYIEGLTKTLTKLNNIKEYLSDDELREHLKLENDAIEAQTSAYEELYKQQDLKRQKLQTNLEEYGVKFNKNGYITNYETVTKYQTDLLNETGNKEYFDNFEKALNSYADLFYDQMQDLNEQIGENTSKIIDNNFEIWTSQMEDLLEKFEDTRDLNDYNAEMAKDFKQVYEDLNLVQDNLEKNFKSLANDTIPTIIMDMEKAEREISLIAAGGESEMFHSMSQAQEYLKEKQEELRDAALETKGVYEDLYNSYLDKINQAIDRMDDFYEQYNRINSILEYNAELTELVYGEKAYDLYDRLYDSQLNASTSQLTSLMQEKKIYEELHAQAEKGTQEQLKYKERLYELEGQINDKTIEHIKLLKDDYANTINKILSSLEKQLTGGSTLSDIEEEWDRVKEKTDKYYNTVEGLYQIQTLSNKMTKEINNASLSGQKELQKVHDKEISYLREKKNLTEYDVQAAEARYQITLKEIALQEAQMNKNAMKLVRDNNGNWTYQYVANQDDIKAKEQDLLDAYNNLYELADKAYTSNIDALIALNKEYLESAREIANDATLTDEERVVKLEQLRDRYLEDYKLLVEENKLYTNDLSVAYNTELAEIIRLGQENLGILPDIEQKFIIDVQDMASVEQEISESLDGIKKTIGTKVSEFDKLSALVENPFISNEKDALDAYDALDKEIKDIGFNITATLPEIKLDLTKEKKELEELAGKWNAVKTNCEDAISKYKEFEELENPTPKELIIKGIYEIPAAPTLDPIYQKVILTYEEESPPPEIETSFKGKDLSLPPSSSDRGQLEIFDGYEGPHVEVPDVSTYPQVPIVPSQQTTTSQGSALIVDMDDIKEDNKNKKSFGETLKNVGNAILDGANWLWEQSQLTGIHPILGPSFDTGGYTGDWGNSSGRLAVLHRKELILNQSDTANILSAVSAIRSISGLNNSINEAMMQGISRMMLEMTGMKANANYNTQSTQSVGDTIYEIHAEFPDANDVNSIREAILSLPNLASQKVLKY